MRAGPLQVLLLILTIAAAPAAVVASADARLVFRLAVAGPEDDTHVAWEAARELQRVARDTGIEFNIAPAPLDPSTAAAWDVMIMPLRSLATQVPALEVLELPFFYPSLAAVHANLDGPLGTRLIREVGDRGWQLLAIWDEGLHVISGLARFDRMRHLMAREFLITRPDPVAERQFQYWKAYARRIRPETREAVLRECLVAGRATTLQQVMREQLYRVHLDVSLTRHRYEGWVAVGRSRWWDALDPRHQQALSSLFAETRDWQRQDAARREGSALAELQRLGMTVHEVDMAERAAFRAPLPDWTELLSDEIGAALKRQLIDLASAGTAAFVTSAGAPPLQPGGDTPPDSEQH